MTQVPESQRSRVLRVLRHADGPLTTEEVAERAGMTRRKVIFPLCSLARDGFVERAGEDRWDRTWSIPLMGAL